MVALTTIVFVILLLLAVPIAFAVGMAGFAGLWWGGTYPLPIIIQQMFLTADSFVLLAIPLFILAGSLIRVRQTAHIINGVLGGLPMDIVPELNERAIGDWNRKTMAETEDFIARKVPPPGGETEEQFSDRVDIALARIVAHSDHRPLVVSSKGVGRMINTRLGGEGNMHVSNGEIVEFMVSVNGEGAQALGVRRPSFI